jgi:hypothetical protein
VILIADDVLHGPKMRELLTVYSMSLGGVDAIVVMSDARGKTVQPGSAEERKIQDAAAQGKYIIAEDQQAPEYLIIVGRSREHQAGCYQRYRREPGEAGDVITFDDKEPVLAQGKQTISLIPDIWDRVN